MWNSKCCSLITWKKWNLTPYLLCHNSGYNFRRIHPLNPCIIIPFWSQCITFWFALVIETVNKSTNFFLSAQLKKHREINANWNRKENLVHLVQGTVICKDTCTPTFTAALFTIAKTWTPLTDEWVKRMWCTYTTECHLAMERMKFHVICGNGWTWILSEVWQRKTNIIWCHLNVESKIWCKWTYLQNRKTQT